MASSVKIRLLVLKKKLLLLRKKRHYKLSKINRRKDRRWWIHPIWRNRDNEGYFHTLVQKMRTFDHAYFKNFTRMSPQLFDELVELLTKQIKNYPVSREPLSPAYRLAITLRFLATGDSLISIAYGFRIGKSAHVVIKETCDALWDTLQPLFLKAPTNKIWKDSAYEYGRQWQYPNCCGAVDGKHVVIQQPANSGSMYYNYKGTNSVVLMAVVDAEYKFLAVDICGFGSSSDGGSNRRCSENDFGILGARWRIYHRTITLAPENVDRIIKATVVLHNYLISKENNMGKSQKIYCPPGYADFTDSLGNYRFGNWNEEPASGLFNLKGTRLRNSTEVAKRCRTIYTDYFWSEEGSVPWQWDMPGVTR